MEVSAIILAAGESRRMGKENKLLLAVHGRPMIRHVVEAVCAADAGEQIVVLGHEAEQVKAVLSDLPVQFVMNPDYREGMSTSIHAGVKAANDDAIGFMICLSDMPFITSKEYELLLSAYQSLHASDDKAILVPVYQEQRGNPVLISTAFKPAILSHQGTVGCKSIVKQHPAHVSRIQMPSNSVVRDVDTPASFQAIAEKK